MIRDTLWGLQSGTWFAYIEWMWYGVIDVESGFLYVLSHR